MLPYFRAQMFGGKKLPYDAEVEWLNRTDTGPYIETPMVVADIGDSKIELVYSIADTSGIVNQSFYGVRISSSYSYALLIGSYATKYSLSPSTKSLGTHSISGATVKVEIDTLHNVVRVNGLVKNVDVASMWENFDRKTNTRKVLLFASNVGYGATGIRIHSFKWWKNDVLKCDFQPVRFTNELGVSEGAMYDKVTKRLFRTDNEYAFTIGPDKARGASAVNGGGV